MIGTNLVSIFPLDLSLTGHLYQISRLH
jgi:hypothetical protein